MPSTTAASRKYNEKSYDRLYVTIPKGKKAIYEAHSLERCESLNAFINRAIVEAYERDLNTNADTAPADTPQASTPINIQARNAQLYDGERLHTHLRNLSIRKKSMLITKQDLDFVKIPVDETEEYLKWRKSPVSKEESSAPPPKTGRYDGKKMYKHLKALNLTEQSMEVPIEWLNSFKIEDEE